MHLEREGGGAGAGLDAAKQSADLVLPAAAGRQHLLELEDGVDQGVARVSAPNLGIGRIAASEIEAPNMLAILA